MNAADQEIFKLGSVIPSPIAVPLFASEGKELLKYCTIRVFMQINNVYIFTIYN